MQAWTLTARKNYHKRHPKAVAFVLRGDSYMTSPIPEAEAKRLNLSFWIGWGVGGHVRGEMRLWCGMILSLIGFGVSS